MSYDRIGNTRIRESGRKRCIFDKVFEIKREIKTILPEVEGGRLISMLSKIRRYYVHKKKGIPLGRIGRKGYRKLTYNERILYEYLLKSNLNPSTTYRWFLATRIPSDIKEKLRQGLIGINKAMQISANRRRVKHSNSGLLMMEEIRTIIRGL